MTDIPSFSPGCFGSALAYKDNDSVCGSCIFSAECRPLHFANKQALQERFGLTPARPARTAPASVENAVPLPKKVRELLQRISKSGIQVSERLARGENPFDGTAMNYMKVVCHLLLRYPGPLDRELIATAFTTKLAWRPDTAEAHARMAIQALTHLGVVNNQEGSIVLRRG